MALAAILVAATVSFHGPANSRALLNPRAAAPKAIGALFGGPEFRLFPSDVQFTDVDGDDVVIRPVPGGTRIDLYVNKKLKFEKATMTKSASGDMLEIQGSVKQGFAFLGALGFQLEDIVVEGVKPRDPADVEKAMALVA